MKEFKNKIVIFLIPIFCFFSLYCISITANAEEDTPTEVGASIVHINGSEEDGVDITLGGFPLNSGYRGTSIIIDDNIGAGYCIQKGYPLRGSVSDIQMAKVWMDTEDGRFEESVIVAEYIREKLVDYGGNGVFKYFVGWGKWALNGNATNAYPLPYGDGVLDNNPKFIPSSGLVDVNASGNSDYTKEGEDVIDGKDSEDSQVGGITTTEYNSGDITGHEGAKAVYESKLKSATAAELGLDTEDTNALAIINYYISRDTDAINNFNTTERRQVMQALTWAVEWDFINATTGLDGFTFLKFENSSGRKTNNQMSGTISCDDYIKIFIGDQYGAMKLYRQFIWKTSNMRTIPKFAYNNQIAAKNNPIKLRWDANESAYIATISDENGVAKYFDFNINGVTITHNDDGTITIKSTNAISETVTSPVASSKLLPEDCRFTVPIYFRWNLEGIGAETSNNRVTFRYSYLTDYLIEIDEVEEEGYETSYVHLHGYDASKAGNAGYELYNKNGYYETGCQWVCNIEDSESPTHCTHVNDINTHYDGVECTHSCKYTVENGGDCDAETQKTCNITEHTHGSDCCDKDEHPSHNSSCTEHDHYYLCGGTDGHTPDCPGAGCYVQYSYWSCGGTHTHGSGCTCELSEHTHSEAVGGCKEKICGHTCTYTDETNGSYDRKYCTHWTPGKTGHDAACKHYMNCLSWNQDKDKSWLDRSTAELPTKGCVVEWNCGLRHYEINIAAFYAQYVDWQDIIAYGAETLELVDPVNAYIALETEPHEFPCETDVDIRLIDMSGNPANHIKVGEMYKLRYIYEYTGYSKGTTIVKTTTTAKTYYQFTYLTRMTTNQNIYNLRSGATTASNMTVPYQYYAANLFNIDIRGSYTTGEQGKGENIYPNKTYKFDSQDLWDDTIKLNPFLLDADGIKNSSTNTSANKVSVSATEHTDGTVTVTWVYETPYEVFTSGLVQATAYINIGSDKNYAGADFEEAFNYGEYEDHNNAGDTGLFTRTELYTQNSERQTYSVKNSYWQSELDITVENVVLNTGAGITQPTFYNVGKSSHWVNYNLYYTIKLEHPAAYYYWHKLRYNNGSYEKTDNKNEDGTGKGQKIITTDDVYQFDVNTYIDWALPTLYGDTNSYIISVDHIQSGKTYIQKEIPANLCIKEVTGNTVVDVTANYDKLIYEEEYSIPTYTENSINSKFTIIMDDLKYDNNKDTDNDVLYPTIDPTKNKPFGIIGNGDYDTLTQFSIVLADGNTATVKDRDEKQYDMYDFTFNTSKNDNKVIFDTSRKSVAFFKYTSGNYTYKNRFITSGSGVFNKTSSTQTERYYISEILFKSNYTYNKNFGTNQDGWINMVTENEKAIVSAGQGFEIKVKVRYENSLLTKYLSRYKNNANVNGTFYAGDNAELANIGTSTVKTPQYCNISSLTHGNEIIYTDGAILGSPTLDRLAMKLISGSNVYADLYCYLSDNKDAVYSALGQYNTPVIFNRTLSYNDDLSAIEFVYTMKSSTTNGVENKSHSKKFYTSQLAPDSETPGIVQNGNLPNGKHSIVFWTPIVAATGFDYPEVIQDRYIGDAIEIGYTIKSTGADDNIVHIVQ